MSLPLLPLQPLIHYSEFAKLLVNFSVAGFWDVTLNALTNQLQAVPHAAPWLSMHGGTGSHPAAWDPCTLAAQGKTPKMQALQHSTLQGLDWVLDLAPKSPFKTGNLTGVNFRRFLFQLHVLRFQQLGETSP